MIENRNYPKLVENYLEGNLSDADRIAFERKLASDTELRNEFDMQKEIIDAIKQERRLELKSRLDGIKVHWYHTIPNSLKIAASITALTISTLSAYYIIDQNTAIDPKVDISEPGNIIELAEPVAKPLVTKPSANETVAEEKTLEPKVFIKESEETIRETNTKTTPAEKTVILPDNREFEAFVPEQGSEFEGNTGIDREDMENDELVTNTAVAVNPESKVEIKSIEHKKYDFHYLFKEGRLSLYGSFNDSPYEILEINSRSGKRFYLRYNDHYYSLKRSDKIMPLVAVTDSLLISELNIAQQNK